MVVERGGLKYTVEAKDKWVGRRGDPPSFAAMRWIGICR